MEEDHILDNADPFAQTAAGSYSKPVPPIINMLWNQKQMTVYQSFITPVTPAAIAVGGDSTDWGADSFGMTAAHVKLGKGDVLFCQMEIAKVVKKDSSAALLARNLLSTILDDKTRSSAVAVYFGGALTIAPVPAEKFRSVSLASAANMGFADAAAGDGKGGWTDQGPQNDLAEFPLGTRLFDGVRFEILDPAKNGGKGCVVVSGNSSVPCKPESVPVAVGTRAKRLLFLHTGAWVSKNAVLGEYLVEYEDGSTVSVPVQDGLQIADWWKPKNHRLHLRNAVSRMLKSAQNVFLHKNWSGEWHGKG